MMFRSLNSLIFSGIMLVLSLLVGGCTQPPQEPATTHYTFSFVAGDATRVLPLTNHEKAITSVFIALYDDQGRLLDCQTTRSAQVSMRVAGSATQLYAIANVLSNNTYEYYHNDLLIDFGGDQALLRAYFAQLNNRTQITLRHKFDGSGRFIAQNNDPLPMCAQCAIAGDKAQMEVGMRLLVSRLEIQSPDPANKISSITIEGLINQAVVEPEQPTLRSPLQAACSIVTSYPTATSIEKSVYYIPENFGEQVVTLSINYVDGAAKNQNCASFFARLMGGKYYTQSIQTLPQQNAISLDVSDVETPYVGQSVPLRLLSTEAWQVTSKPDWVQVDISSGKGSDQPYLLTLTIQEYPGTPTLDRVGRVVFTDSQSNTATLTITQAKRPDIYLKPPVDYQAIPARSSGFTQQWRVSDAGIPCLASSDVSWIHWQYAGNLPYWATDRDAITTFTFDPNTSRTPRTGVIKLHRALPNLVLGPVYDYRQVTQAGIVDFLTASPTTFTARARGENYDLLVEHSDVLHIDALPDWITLHPESTVNHTTNYKLTIARNSLAAARSATIRITMQSGEGDRELLLPVTQTAAFTQSYPFKLQYSMVVKATAHHRPGNVFVGANGGFYNYANTVVVYLPDGGETGQINRGRHGLVTDPPYATSIATSPFSDEDTTVPAYRGAAIDLQTLVVVSASSSTYFRNAAIPITIPAGLTSEDKLVITMELKDVVFWPLTYQYSVQYDIR